MISESKRQWFWFQMAFEKYDEAQKYAVDRARALNKRQKVMFVRYTRKWLVSTSERQ